MFLQDNSDDANSIAALAKKLICDLNIQSRLDILSAKSFFELALVSAPIDGSLPKDESALKGFRLAQHALYNLRSDRKSLNNDGILWRGRPAFITNELLHSLQQEFDARRHLALHDRWGQYLGEPGPVTKELLHSPELSQMVSQYVGSLGSSVKASCIFYDQEGAYIRPHVDTDNYSVNANLLVDHFGEKSSKLIVYPVGEEPKEIELSPGELVLFYADCVVHSRTPLGNSETVRALSLGFQIEKEFGV